MAFVETEDGVKLFYNDWGQGPAVILIHGWPASADMWEHQALFLAENGYRVISYDRRGFGRSSQPFSGVLCSMNGVTAAISTALAMRALPWRDR